MSTYVRGSLVRVSGAFTNAAGTAVDPATVTFKSRSPDRSVALSTLVYGVDAALVKDSTGNYHVDVDANANGTWWWRWESTGMSQAADEGSFDVELSQVIG